MSAFARSRHPASSGKSASPPVRWSHPCRNRSRINIDQIDQRSASAVRDATLITGTIASPYGVPRPVVKTCMFIAAASCSVPQMKSLAGVAAKIRPFAVTRSPGPETPAIGSCPPSRPTPAPSPRYSSARRACCRAWYSRCDPLRHDPDTLSYHAISRIKSAPPVRSPRAP